MKTKKSKFPLILGVIILFVFAFIILIDKQNERNMGDVYSSVFGVTPIANERIVARDLNSIYPKYYVVYCDNTDDSYIIHSFNYYQNKEQYELEFSRLYKDIVDYDYENNMIRYVYSSGYDSYNELLNNLGIIVSTDNIEIYQ